MGKRRAPVLAVLVLALASCASPNERSDYDPFEGFNRKVFWFNLQTQKYVLDPIATAWHWAVPDVVERSISRFFDNLLFPIDFVNNLLQGKPKEAGIQTARFVINSTVGVAGLLDPAEEWGLENHPEDFGQTLAVWGLASGPYLMLPFWGPANVREGIGLIADSYSSVHPYFLDLWVSAALVGTDVVNDRGLNLEASRRQREVAIDYYVFVRDGYFQHRRALIEDTAVIQPTVEEDLYEDLYDDPVEDDPVSETEDSADQ